MEFHHLRNAQSDTSHGRQQPVLHLSDSIPPQAATTRAKAVSATAAGTLPVAMTSRGYTPPWACHLRSPDVEAHRSPGYRAITPLTTTRPRAGSRTRTVTIADPVGCTYLPVRGRWWVRDNAPGGVNQPIRIRIDNPPSELD